MKLQIMSKNDNNQNRLLKRRSTIHQTEIGKTKAEKRKLLIPSNSSSTENSPSMTTRSSPSMAQPARPTKITPSYAQPKQAARSRRADRDLKLPSINRKTTVH